MFLVYMTDRWLVGGPCPNGANGIAFRCGAIEGDNLLSWDIDAVEVAFLGRFFEEGFFIFRREILSVETQIPMKYHFVVVIFRQVIG